MNKSKIEKSVPVKKEIAPKDKQQEKLLKKLTNTTSKLKKAEEKINKIQRLYAFISQVNKNIVRINDETTLFQNACQMALEFGKFKMAWIGVFDEKHKKITLVGHSGISDKDVKLFTNTDLQADGPQAFVLKNKTHYLCNDIHLDLKLGIWKSFAEMHHILSYMVLPIKKLGRIVGTINLYSTELNFVEKEELDLLVEVTDDISYALESLEKEKLLKETENQLI